MIHFLKISWDFIWNNSATFLGIGAAIWAFASALWAKYLEGRFRMREDEQKKRLETDFERYKTALSHFAFINQKKFGWLLEKRTEIVFGSHDLFQAALNSLENIAVDTTAANNTLLVDFKKVNGALSAYLNEFGLYFPLTILKDLGKCYNVFESSASQLFTGFKNRTLENPDAVMADARLEFAKVEAHFRVMLGATIENL